MYDQLAELLKHYKSIEEGDIELLHKYFQPREFKKGDFLATANEVCNDIIFIGEGYFQCYVLNDIEEKTIDIIGCVDFITALSSFITRVPNDEYIQAITDAKTLSINYDDLQALYDHSKGWERLGRTLMENQFVREQKLVISFVKHTAQMRYENLISNRPDLFQHVPLRIIASFIGVTPETLSRIRAKKF